MRFTLESSDAVRAPKRTHRGAPSGHRPVSAPCDALAKFAHPSLADQGGDFIRAEATAWADGHLRRILQLVVDGQ